MPASQRTQPPSSESIKVVGRSGEVRGVVVGQCCLVLSGQPGALSTAGMKTSKDTKVQLMNNYCLSILVMLTVELDKGSITSPGCRCWGPTWSHGVVIADLCVGLSMLRS